jgi:hypothetical protein
MPREVWSLTSPIHPLLTLSVLASAVACGPEGEDSVDLGDPVAPLVLPDVSDVDFPTAYQEAVQLAKGVHTGRAWEGHVASLGRRFEGCPDMYSGVPDDDTVDIESGDEPEGATWFDDCTTPGSIDYHGYVWWDGTVAVDGDPEDREGVTVDATRTLDASGVVSSGEDVAFELRGEATDSLSEVVAPKYRHWTWSSDITATVTGTDVFANDSQAPGGWRTDMALYATGGDSNVLEARGNVFLFDHRMQDRFDSIEMDVAFLGEGAYGPDDCTEEPAGWIGLRDENAYWYDVVFLPRYEEETNDTATSNDPYTACDGCGTIYLRGVEATEIGEVCMDFGFVWSDQPVEPPAVEDYVLSLHQLQSEAP